MNRLKFLSRLSTPIAGLSFNCSIAQFSGAHTAALHTTSDDDFLKLQTSCSKVFENDKFLILNKANGVDVMDYKKWKGSYLKLGLFSILRKEIDSKLRNIHRIDKYVTGGLLIAKNKNVAKQFSKNLQYGGNKGYIFKRRYVAMISDSKIDAENLDPCVTLTGEGKGTIHTIDDDGTESVTKFIICSSVKHNGRVLVVIQLETGRKHQIRLHLSRFLKRPLSNDSLYGAKYDPRFPNVIGLHSSFIYTRVGLKEEKVLIPVRYSSALWDRFVDQDGYFSEEVNKVLVDFDSIF